MPSLTVASEQTFAKFTQVLCLLTGAQVLQANWYGITLVLYVGMSLQNVFLPSVYTDRVNTLTGSWLLHSELCRCCSEVVVHILQKNSKRSHQLLKTSQPNPTLPGWKRSISLEYVVCIEEWGKKTGQIFLTMAAESTLEYCHYTVH